MKTIRLLLALLVLCVPLAVQAQAPVQQIYVNPKFADSQDGNPSLLGKTVGALNGIFTTRVSSTAYEASHVLLAKPGNLVSLVGYNSGGAGFVQVFDAATVPTDGAAPVITFAVTATSNFSYDLAVMGLPFTNGIVVCFSTTGPTKTLGGAGLYLTALVK